VARGERGLMEDSVAVRPGAAVGVVLASAGYPDAALVGRPLAGADPTSRDDAGPLLCFHAATRRAGASYESSGGRVATFVGLGHDLAAARARAYAGIEGATLDGGWFRHDIALREIESAS
ncbi:MAG TPA: phosphoribosylglycinamide synthetase C domain-containing protein, partial [Candidatus Limnocylindria bacterium]|nr:phosphoribosylglycinamide synthetase C domain-containing protein [Candidatus Limnocylindria bacterium]